MGRSRSMPLGIANACPPSGSLYVATNSGVGLGEKPLLPGVFGPVNCTTLNPFLPSARAITSCVC